MTAQPRTNARRRGRRRWSNDSAGCASSRLSVAGFLLGIGGPKRLVLTCLAAATIVTAGLGDADQTALVVVYVTLATALVWGPLILFLFIGKRVIALMEGAQGEVARRQPQVTFYALLILAALLVLDAVSVLLT